MLSSIIGSILNLGRFDFLKRVKRPSFGFVSSSFAVAAHRSSATMPTLASPYEHLSRYSQRSRRMLLTLLGLLAIIACIYHYIFAPKGLLARNVLRDQIAISQMELNHIAQSNMTLAREIGMLDGDTQTIELMARSELNMAFPGESVYREKAAGPPSYVLNLSSQE